RLWRIANPGLRGLRPHDFEPAASPARLARRQQSQSRSAGVTMSMYYAGILSDIGILVLGALSVYVILATGQLSLGNAGFMGIGAYLTSYLTVVVGLPITAALIVAALVSVLIGIAVVFPALRLKGIYLAMPTLGFA